MFSVMRGLLNAQTFQNHGLKITRVNLSGGAKEKSPRLWKEAYNIRLSSRVFLGKVAKGEMKRKEEKKNTR